MGEIAARDAERHIELAALAQMALDLNRARLAGEVNQ